MGVWWKGSEGMSINDKDGLRMHSTLSIFDR